MGKKLVNNDVREGYILGIDAVIENGFQLSHDDKKKLIQAFDKMYEVKVATVNMKGDG